MGRVVPGVDGASGLDRRDRWQLQLYGIVQFACGERILESDRQIAERMAVRAATNGALQQQSAGSVCARSRTDDDALDIACGRRSTGRIPSPQVSCLFASEAWSVGCRRGPTRSGQTRVQTRPICAVWATCTGRMVPKNMWNDCVFARNSVKGRRWDIETHRGYFLTFKRAGAMQSSTRSRNCRTKIERCKRMLETPQKARRNVVAVVKQRSAGS